MKVGRVIGRVVLSAHLPELTGARWLLVSPLGRAELENDAAAPWSSQPSAVVYDDLGAASGDLIGYVEGGEATLPFDRPMPIDAYNCCLFDQVTLNPKT